jgi:hypothetical protein
VAFALGRLRFSVLLRQVPQQLELQNTMMDLFAVHHYPWLYSVKTAVYFQEILD